VADILNGVLINYRSFLVKGSVWFNESAY